MQTILVRTCGTWMLTSCVARDNIVIRAGRLAGSALSRSLGWLHSLVALMASHPQRCACQVPQDHTIVARFRWSGVRSYVG